MTDRGRRRWMALSVVDDSFLETCNKVEPLRVFFQFLVFLNQPQYRGFDPAKTKVERTVRDLRHRERNGVAIPALREPINHGPAGIGKSEELGHLVIGFAGGVISRFTDELVLQLTKVAGLRLDPK